MAGQDEPKLDDPEQDDDDPNPFDFAKERDLGLDPVSDEEAYLDDVPNEPMAEDAREPMVEADEPEMDGWVAAPVSESLSSSNGHRGQRPKDREWQLARAARPRTRPERPVAITAEVKEEDSLVGAVAITAEHELMETLAEAAEGAPTRAGACHLVAAMVPLAIQLASRYRAELRPVLPVLVEGAASAAGIMVSQPASRPFIRIMPAILERTVRLLAYYAAQGRPLTRQVAADALAEVTGTLIEEHYRAARRGRRSAPSLWDEWVEDYDDDTR